MSSEPTPDPVPDFLNTGSMLDLSAKIAEEVPPQLAGYTIVRRIGQGGMGVVYLAEQAPPLARQVAIKVARNALPDGRALARFESERQALAVMNHPNIARVFDAGSAPDGRPYFVMEHVAGETIVRFCETRRLGVEPRLDLFLRVCAGVQHAHLNAVIHRDIKPSNILVTTEGGPPTPKIIDFGVAKALGAGAAIDAGLTQFGQIVGTPEYMSPEQAALDGRLVDTRTDVYALGVLLYELLVGSRPFERDRNRNESFVDLCRRIREDEPERPSARAARVPGAPALARKVRGDLDAIAMKALAKEPGDRYASPSELAADVERHLQHRPIQARRPSVLLRWGKTIRRHRAATAVIASLTILLIGIAGVGTAMTLRARQEAVARKAIREFLLGIMDPPEQVATRERRMSLIQASDRQVLLDRIREEFADQPILLAQMLLAAGNSPAFDDARPELLLQEARDGFVSHLGADSPEALEAAASLGRRLAEAGRFSEAESLVSDMLDRRRRLVGPDHPDTWRATSQLAFVYKLWWKHDRAVPLFDAAIAGLERLKGPDDPDVLSMRVGLSGCYLPLRRYGETQVLLEGMIDRVRRVFGERHFQTRVVLYNLACAHANLGEVEPALGYLRDAIELGWNYPFGPARDPLLLPLHGDPRFFALDRAGRLNDRITWDTALFEASRSLREGHLADAEQRLSDLLAALKRIEGNTTGRIGASATRALATCWIRQGRFAEAEQLLLKASAAAQTDAARGDTRRSLELLAQCDLGRGRRDSALERLAAAVPLTSPEFENVELLYDRASTEAIRGRDDAALELLARASDLGLAEADRLEHDLAFAGLSSRPEFKAIVRAVRQRSLG
ncbi:MAG TPA: protein kinase [Candidatus Polarisedimenticolaceae bacterium]|nr:protein kinase [Candidatus Polarisedimenticolaceae bacterium]